MVVSGAVALGISIEASFWKVSINSCHEVCREEALSATDCSNAVSISGVTDGKELLSGRMRSRPCSAKIASGIILENGVFPLHMR